MLSHYFLIAIRNSLRDRLSTSVNLFSLAAGMAITFLAGLWVTDELTFNKSHRNYDRIGQIMSTESENAELTTTDGMSIPLSSELRKSYGSTFEAAVLSTGPSDHVLTVGSKSFTVSGGFMEAAAPDLLSLKMISGSYASLRDMNSIILASSTAKLLFSESDAVGKTIRFDGKQDFTVSGVFEDIASNSDFRQFNFIASWSSFLAMEEWFRSQQDDWTVNMFRVYVQLADQVDFASASSQIRNLKYNNLPLDERDGKPILFVHPMSNWHLYSQFENGSIVASQGLMSVWFYSLLGTFVLLLACINFMNLTTARSERRSKEVGIRKSIGSSRTQLVSQFLSESIVTVLLAFFFSLVIVQTTLPWFNDISGKQISVQWTNPNLIALCIIFILVTGLIAGIYPALYLSRFKLRGITNWASPVGGLALPRRALVVIQFGISVSLMIGTIVVFRQVDFSKSRERGYQTDQLVFLNIRNDDVHLHFDAIRQELINKRIVEDMAESTVPVTRIHSINSGFAWKGQDPASQVTIAHISISHTFGKVVGWNVAEGRDFSLSVLSDSTGAIINRSAARAMGFTNPVGEVLARRGKQYKIIGVVDDMVMQSPYNPTIPTIFTILEFRGGVLSLKLDRYSDTRSALNGIGTVLDAHTSDTPLEFYFADDEYELKFASEERTRTLTSVFAGFAVLISTLGLFALVSFVSERRTKEIGIRKVLGASVLSLCALITKEFVILIVISCVVAIPIAYFFAEKWLQGYAYRVENSAGVYGVACAILLIVALFTVVLQTLKASLANPVTSLRVE